MATITTPTIKNIFRMTEFDLLRTKAEMGNMYMCVDTQMLYYDSGPSASNRQIYNYISVRTVNELFYDITPEYGKTYYCWEDNSLWIWINKWVSLYGQTTYPSAYVYDDIPDRATSKISEIYRYDMPNLPADDNGLLRDGSVVVRDRNRIIKGKLFVNDENDNLVLSSFLGGGIRFLPNGKMNDEGELFIGSRLNAETRNQETYATIRAKLSVLNDEMFIDYSEHPELDKNRFPNSNHIYKIYHQGNLDTSKLEVMTPQQTYDLLLDESLPRVLELSVRRLNGHEDSYFAPASHTHGASDISDLYSMVQSQAGIAVRTIFNNISGNGITGSYDVSTQLLTLSANSFRISLAGGVVGSNIVQGLSDIAIETTVDPDKHKHTNYETKLTSLQNQIDAINVDVNTTYTRDVIDTKIANITPTSVPTAGYPLLVNSSRILPATSASAKQLDHNITLNLVGSILGSVEYNGSTSEINIDTSFNPSGTVIQDTIVEALSVREYTTIIGNDVDTIYNIQHNLQSKNLIIQFRNANTGSQVYIDNTCIDDDTVQVRSNQVLDIDEIIVTILKI